MIPQTILWRGLCGARVIYCSVASGCAGVDLQIFEGESSVRRERHADRATAYERARALRAEFELAGFAIEDARRAPGA